MQSSSKLRFLKCFIYFELNVFCGNKVLCVQGGRRPAGVSLCFAPAGGAVGAKRRALGRLSLVNVDFLGVDFPAAYRTDYADARCAHFDAGLACWQVFPSGEATSRGIEHLNNVQSVWALHDKDAVTAAESDIAVVGRRSGDAGRPGDGETSVVQIERVA